MGKKLARTALKLRTEQMQAQRRERLEKAQLLLERWGQQQREQEQGVWLSGNEPENIEDEMTAEVMSNLNQQVFQIARWHWAMGLPPSQLATKQQLPRSEVREALALVKEQVANKVLM